MMSSDRQRLAKQIEAAGMVAIIRAERGDRLVETCQALEAGGVRVAEITLNTPGALEGIAAVARNGASGFMIGAGTVLDARGAREAVEAGAQFIVAPTFKMEVLEAAHEQGKPVLPGAFTPTEILTAWEAGAEFVKVFPANHFGPGYVREVLAPLPKVKLLPTGGVNLETIETWFAAGASCLGVGTSLVSRELVAREDWSALTARAAAYVEAVDKARESLGR